MDDADDEVDAVRVTDAHYTEPAWADYVRTSPIMSNVPVTSHPTERAPLARIDERMLADGHDQTASPWRAVVPMVYLARRAKLLYASNTHSYRPLWIHLGIIAGAGLASIVGPLVATVFGKLSDAGAYYDTLLPG
ncbi:hypothetical protein [Homoserinimonas hongtaonis]|uniref:Uncharacterized protein n=1 Tax=Homoserinimonas hongtaonis TaxID=2079791 RepID=A0A2U1T0A0_9MICO|nr:hypothetical protein [Salinibacterium hongtaonis]PWB97289.1 hypothetical protein DF220_05180 [Salinibacterium hongtaonis]